MDSPDEPLEVKSASLRRRGQEGHAESKCARNVASNIVLSLVASVREHEDGDRAECAHKDVAHAGVIVRADRGLKCWTGEKHSAEGEHKWKCNTKDADSLPQEQVGDDKGVGWRRQGGIHPVRHEKSPSVWLMKYFRRLTSTANYKSKES